MLNEETGNNWSESAYRKFAFPYIQGWDDAIDEGILDGELFVELEQKRLEFEKEKIKFQDQRREYYKLVRGSARDEHIYDLIREAAENLHNKQPFEWQPISTSSSNKHGVALWSDWHSEIDVDNFLNTFNKTEFKKRINKLVDKTIEYGMCHDIQTLHVFNLGDLFSGVIRNTLRIMSNENIVTQTMYISELIADILYQYACSFKEVKFYNVIDNHSRVVANKNDSLNLENFSRFVPWYVQTRLADVQNVHIINNALDEEIAIVDICGYTCFAVHGHCDKITNVVSNLSMMTKKIPDYVFMAHYHHNASNEFHGCEVVVNPSLVGADDYSKSIRKTSKPAQKFMVFSQDEGLVCTYSIRLD